jgi:ABC-type multidrug transport system fused ATPase/permease subunit
MDHATQAQVQENLKAFIENRTVIVVAHRLSALSYVDRVITLENGTVTENGSPEELVGHGGYFAKMVQQMSERFGRSASRVGGRTSEDELENAGVEQRSAVTT